MKRSMMQVYVKGSKEALALYKRAFDGRILAEYEGDVSGYMHAELDVQGQVIAVSEANASNIIGDAMQFCFHYGEGGESYVERAYEALREGGKVVAPLGECSFSPLMACVIDKFGVNWCLFV